MIEKLEEFINSYKDKEVVWGVDDCTAWAAKWAEIATGGSIILPPYDSREQAGEIIKHAGGLVELVSQYLGPEESFGEPEIGDVAVIQTGKHDLVTVLMLRNNVAVWRTDQGVRLFRVRPRHIEAYWTVGSGANSEDLKPIPVA